MFDYQQSFETLSEILTPAHTASPLPSIHEIIAERKLTAVFQPILDLSGGAFIGFEGLIRGPANSPLHSPIKLFRAAEDHGLSLEIEMLCRQVVMEQFAQQKLPGKLFLNISPQTLTHPSFKSGQTLECLKKVGLKPSQIIIEITENQPTFDFAAVRNAMLHYREMGFQIALDDLGEGFSSLRLWSELRPDFVKIDMHFVQGVNADPVKLQFLRSIQQIAESCDSQVIAEGIETDAELNTIRTLGIALGQGYFIARPQTVPPLQISQETHSILNGSKMPSSSNAHALPGQTVTAERLLVYVEPVSPDTENSKVFKMFSENTELRTLPVVKHGKPVGLINRYSFIDSFAQPFRRELLGKKACRKVMQEHPLLVDKNTPVQELSQFLVNSESRHFTDGFVITDDGQYLGIGTGQDLLRVITQMQIESARYANPLTLLPGNVPINEEIERLIKIGAPFHACYCDLDNFKPFNDVYGYRKGDEMIQLTGRVLTAHCDPKLDFLGHIGGDDFIILMRSENWQQRCDDILRSFAELSVSLATQEHRWVGGYESEDRQGQSVFHPLPTLSIGAVPVSAGHYDSHHEISSAAAHAKKMAKKSRGNSLFVDQRRT